MWLDQRQGYLEAARRGLSMMTYPVQVAVNSPAAFWDWLHEVFATRERLQKENAELKLRLRDTDFRLMRSLRSRAGKPAAAWLARSHLARRAALHGR